MHVDEKKRGVRAPYTYQKLKDVLLAARARKSLRALGREYGVSHGVIQRVLAGEEPKQPHIRRALGLPVYATVPICAKCGRPHVTKRCASRKPTFEENCAAWDRWKAENQAALEERVSQAEAASREKLLPIR